MRDRSRRRSVRSAKSAKTGRNSENADAVARGAVIGYDRSYRGSDVQKIIVEISRALGHKPREEIKKSLDPVSLLEILGVFVIGNFAGGFINKCGADAWDAVKSGLNRLTRKGPRGSRSRSISMRSTKVRGRPSKLSYRIRRRSTSNSLSVRCCLSCIKCEASSQD